MNDAPFACRSCGHDIELHKPSRGGRDRCDGQRATARSADGRALELHEKHGTRCDCAGFSIKREVK